MKKLTKIPLLFIAFTMMSMNVWAQQRSTVTGTVVDDETGKPVAGALVGFFPAGSTTQATYTATDDKGAFSISQLPFGDYKFIYSFITFREDTVAVTVNRNPLNLGEIRLVPDTKQISTATIAGTAPRASVQGDTLTFNADAFKTNRDATAGDLVSKMGMTVENGTVTVMGDQVQKIFLDGKEFFGEDVAMAINSLPAEMISGVESYTRLSDESMFTGIDDGSSFRALNFITKGGVVKATFGQVKGTYGFDDKYLIGGNVTFMRDERKLTFAGTSNNINVTNTSTNDLDGGARNFLSSGQINSNIFSTNYINKWNKVEFSGNYRLSHTKTLYETIRERNYFVTEGSTDFERYESTSEPKNLNHDLSARILWQNGNHRLQIRPSLTISDRTTNSNDTSFRRTTLLATNESSLVNALRNISKGDNNAYSFGLSSNYTYVISPGRNISLNLSGRKGNNDGTSRSESLAIFYNPLIKDLRLQNITNKSKNYNISANIRYTEPLSKNSRLTANYSFRHSYDDGNRSNYLWDPNLEEYIFSDSLSNVSLSKSTTHNIGPGFNYSDGTATVNFEVFYENNTLSLDQTFPIPLSDLGSRSFEHITYNGMLRYKLNTSSNLRIDVGSSTINPYIRNLQDVLDITNPLYVSQGNPNLRSTYNNRFSASYNTANLKNAHTFSVRVGGNIYSNYMGSSVIIAESNGTVVRDENGNEIITLNKGAQYTRPVNLDGRWNMNANANYTLPVKFLRSNLNIGAGTNFSALPNILNGVKNTSNSSSYNGMLRLSSNISENLDFNIFYRLAYTDTRNKELPQSNNKNINNMIGAGVKWITWKGITLTANSMYSNSRRITYNNNTEILMVNATLGKRIFNGLGEINVGVSDIFNQAKSYSYSVNEYYTQETWTNMLGRYASINFIYNIRSYNGASMPQNMQRGETPQRMGGERPQGMPGGGNVRTMGPPPGGGNMRIGG